MRPCLVEYSTVGADHFAKGAKNFKDWSAAMLREFGDISPKDLKDAYDGARSIHLDAQKAFQGAGAAGLKAAKTRAAQDIAGMEAKLQRGDFTREPKAPAIQDKALFQMRQRLNALKGEFERHVADLERKNASPGQKLV